jgi:DDE_Tnp_1-associated
MNGSHELCMDYTTLPTPSDEGKMLEPRAVASLYKALQPLSDGRRAQGKRYELALILCVLVLAKMAGETSLSGATEWIRHRAALLAEQFGLRRKVMPCQMTYCNVLARVDAKHLDEILASFFVR